MSLLQACETVQFSLLSLHNLLHHPALASCLTAEHQLAYDKAVKSWAPAILKIRSPAGVSEVGRTSIADGTASGVQDAAGGRSYCLYLHHEALVVAAKATYLTIHQASGCQRPAYVV